MLKNLSGMKYLVCTNEQGEYTINAKFQIDNKIIWTMIWFFHVSDSEPMLILTPEVVDEFLLYK